MILIKASAGNLRPPSSMKQSSQRNSPDDRPSFPGNRPQTLLAIALALVWWFVAWQAANVLIVSAPLAHADAIAVLAGSAAYKERTQRAAELFREGRASKIVVTNDNHQGGWASDEQRNIPYQELATRALRRQGVPESAIETLPEPVTSTYDESLLLRKYAQAHGLHSLLVVTSAYHSRRALGTLRQTFSTTDITVGLEAVTPGWQAPSPAAWWLYLRGWQMVPGEYVKLVYYWLARRLS
jgi:uncharacterized SAM-binding protein YcdF (DUF218 family)